MPELIDRKYLIAYLAAIKPNEYVSAYGEAAVDVINHVERFVAEMPTIEPEVRNGRWIRNATSEGYHCSNCGHKTDLGFAPSEMIDPRDYPAYLDNYCGGCGARMDFRTPTEAALDMADSVMMGGADNGS